MIAIIRFLGTNCEFDTQYAFEKLGFKTKLIWHKETKLPEDTKLIVVPGGFSYGDYLRSGAIAKFSPIMKSLKEFANSGGKVLGICNGFQILTEIGLLDGALKRNDNLHFISKKQNLLVANRDNSLMQEYKENEVINLPIAHADGNYYIDPKGLEELKANNQIMLYYSNEDGTKNSINGSVEAIAGICNKDKNVFGLMPHPERAIELILGANDGVKMLKGIVA